MRTKTTFQHYKALVLVLFTITILSCNVKKPTATGSENQHNAFNSLDWQGSYRGTLPCANCNGIQTIIRLNADQSFRIEESYMGKSNSPIISSGKFQINAAANTIQLEGRSPGKYKVAENRLIQLDMQGNEISGAMKELYVLQKEINPLAGKYWKLTELMGKAVVPGGQTNEAHLLFSKEDNSVSGSGGCNRLSGTYELKGTGIRFSPIAATRMLCEDMRVENELLRILNETDNYSLKGDTLSLNKARMAPLARFVGVDK